MKQEMLQVRPVNSQVRYRAGLVPPNYNLATTDVAAALAGKLAETFNLKSRDILFNQGALSTSYLTFRYFISVEQLRYLDVAVGADQAEILFVNPTSMSALKEEFLKVWDPLMNKIKPKLAEHHFEASINFTAEGMNGKRFLDQFVSIQSEEMPGVEKGFLLNIKYPESNAQARISLETSVSVPDGLFLFFTYTIQKTITDLASLKGILQSTINTYQSLQPMAHIKVMEEI